jgi:linoleoyl-CoA desaturase
VNSYFKEKNISMKDNGNMAVKSVVLFSLYLVPFILILTVDMNVWSMLLLSVLSGIGMAGTGMSVMHDAVHGSFSNKKWMNKFVGSSMYMLGGNVFNWKVQHNIMHHTFTNIQGFDEDIRSRAVIRLSQHAPALKIHRYQHIYAFFIYGLMSLSQFTKDFWQLAKYNRSGVTRQQQGRPVGEYIKLILTKVLYLLVVIGLPILLTSFSWWQVLLGFLVMHITAGVIMSTIFQMAHIVEGAEQPQPNLEGNIENEWAIHQLYTTANFAKNNLLLNWFIGGLNFQIEHHLFPNICHVHYRAIAPIVEQTAREFGLPYNMKPTFIEAVASHLRMLKELGSPTAVDIAA